MRAETKKHLTTCAHLTHARQIPSSFFGSVQQHVNSVLEEKIWIAQVTKETSMIDTYFYIKYHTIITLLWKRLIRRLNTLKVKIILVFRLGVQLRPRVILGTGMCQKFQDFLLQLLQLGLLKFRFFSYKGSPSWTAASQLRLSRLKTLDL